MASILDFGGVCDGVTDNTVAINAAALSGKPFYFPAGNYITAGGHAVNCNGQIISGEARSGSVITCTSPTAPVFTVGDVTGAGFRSLTITRNVAATSSAAFGINCLTTQSDGLLEDLIVSKHWHGIGLGATDYSLVHKVIAIANAGSGILLTNTCANGALQWTLDKVLSSENGANGIYVCATSAASIIALGEWNNVSTFANSGLGAFAGGLATCPIYGVRIMGGFFGTDGAGGIELDTYGSEHKLVGVFTEQAGTSPTGPGLSTPKSNSGHGISITANNIDAMLSGCYAEGNSGVGFVLGATESTVSGCKSISNGMGAGPSFGFDVLAGRAMLSGCRAGNLGGTSSQTYGIVAASGSGLAVVGCDLTGNSSGTIYIVAGASAATLLGNLL